MLTHNRLPVTMRGFQSLEKTRGGNFGGPDVHWYILDNASVDGMTQWALNLAKNRPKQFSVFASTFNRGVSGGRDFLLHHAQPCDYLVFLDNDITVSDPAWLDKLVAPLDHPEIGIVGPAGHYITVDKKGRWQWFEATPRGYVGECDVVSGYCQAFRWADVHGGNLSIDTAYGQYWLEDSDFCLQARAGAMTVYTLPIPIIHHYAGSGDDGSGPEKMKYMASKWQGKGLIRAEQP